MKFSDKIINWYRINKRDLPWRHTNDAYLIWMSEIILQQTRVEQGMPYYLRFLEQYPDVKSFANATEDEILKLWQGLGYYSRGRNMLKTAKFVMENHEGQFPTDYNSLIKLTGIGEYTAAAISSFSSNEAKAVVDGNVYRLLSRHFGIETPINTGAGKKQFQEIADELLDKKNAAEYNQAIIEFGALQCKPRNPDCLACPLIVSCSAYQNNRVHELPVKLKKLKVKERHFYYFVIVKNNNILIKRRNNNDIWAGLHDFPIIESAESLDLQDVLAQDFFTDIKTENTIISSVSQPIKHILTHQRIFGTFIELSNIKDDALLNSDYFWVSLNDLEQYAQPKLIFAFIKNFPKLNKN